MKDASQNSLPNAPADPTTLSHAPLAHIVTLLQQWLYLDDEKPARPVWNLNKEWQSVDVCCNLSSLLDAYGLTPKESDVADTPPQTPTERINQ